MTHPETICSTIVGQLTTDPEGFRFYYGTPPHLNFAADEFVYPMVFLHKPITATIKNTTATTRLVTCHVTLLFTYMVKVDETEPNKFTNAKVKAWDAEKEFIVRLRNYDSRIVRDVVSEDVQDVDHLFDINLAGCVANISFTIVDAGSVCIS